MSSNTNTSNDPRTSFLAIGAKGLDMAGRGHVMKERGNALLTVAVLIAAKSVRGDAETYADMIRHAMGLHIPASNKDGAIARKSAWSYWQALFDTSTENKKFELGMSRVTSETNPDSEPVDRQEENSPISARISALLKATSILVAFDASNINWNGVTLNAMAIGAPDTNEEAKSNQGHVFVSIENAKSLFGSKKEVSISKLKVPLVTIETYGNFRFTTLDEAGREVMRHHKVLPPKKDRPTTMAETIKGMPIRELGPLIAEKIDNEDTKSMDSDILLALLLTTAHELNSGERNGVRFTKKQAETIFAVIEEAKADAATRAAMVQKAAA